MSDLSVDASLAVLGAEMTHVRELLVAMRVEQADFRADIEQRMRKLEAWRWQMGGALALLGAMVGWAVKGLT